jgi:uncharacterized protein YgfB (UPF0149 family)
VILNMERDALIVELIEELHNLAQASEDQEEDIRDLADCIAYMRGLWKAERKRFRKEEGSAL